MEVSASSSLTEKLSAALKNDNDLIKECQDIASDIEYGKLKLVIFVEELAPFLTDKNVTSRAQGTLALSTTLKHLSKDFLNENELNFITNFYCDRMKDQHEVIPSVLQGVLTIVQMSRLPQDSPARLLNLMFQHVHCQSQLQPIRKLIYLIFQTLLQNRKDALRSMGPDFIYGVISSIDGERDPRNLMLLFDMLPNFIQEFPLGHLTEEMFEVIACYFPVDFNSSASEAQTVTRDDLAYALAPCLYASPEFAEFCIPLIIERLDSSLRLAKLDSLYLLRKGASTYGASRLQPHLAELWPIIRKEVFPGGDIEMRNAGLETITELVKVLSTDDVIRDSFIEKVITDTKSSLCDVQLSLYWPAEKLLEAVAKANKLACAQVLKTFIPLCLGQYSTKTSYSDRVTLTESLNSLMAICEEQRFVINSVPELAWTDIPTLYLNALNTDNIELKLKTFSGLAILKSSLSDVARKLLYEKICMAVDDGNNQLKNTCHICLSTFAKIYPNEILGTVINQLAINDSNTDNTVFTHRLQALCAVAKIPELGPQILPNVVVVAMSNKLEKSIAALCCLRKLVAGRSDTFSIQHFLYKNCNIVELLVSADTSGCSTQKLNLIASICRSIVRKLDVKDQQQIVNKYVSILSEKLSESNVIVLEGLLTPLQRNVDIANKVNLLKNLLHLAINSVSSSSKEVSSKLISVLINKQTEDKNFLIVLNMLRDRIKNILEHDSNTELKESAILLNTWLTKALVVRGSQNSQEYLDFHINLLKDMEMGHNVANGFKTLSDRFEDTVTEENFCNVKLFYKQRIFQNVIQKNNDFDAQSRENYLMALTHLIEEVPMELLLMHLEPLIPLLIESMALDSSELILSTLVTLKVLLDTGHKIFHEQAQHFIPKLLSLTKRREMKVRTAALECLLHYANYPTVLILPFKTDVLERLAVAIDDRKRLVRSIAVKARTRWYLVGAPGEPKQS
ncbi:MMS19 nucleotide excision repair protein homolog [Neodiprion lecontei]|uniref:MMS19 nucleotide excision repair protein n=1 Tax=Neodiprion lecontei TaxID=441921 RepID=A0A6J0BHD7_NEOLC|nr:MMS19 nucleotide excision repair protein homolog [Neodiprion lecontei]